MVYWSSGMDARLSTLRHGFDPRIDRKNSVQHDKILVIRWFKATLTNIALILKTYTA